MRSDNADPETPAADTNVEQEPDTRSEAVKRADKAFAGLNLFGQRR